MTDAQKEPTDIFLEAVALIEKKDSIDSITEAIQKLNIVFTSPKGPNDKLLEVGCLFYLARTQQAVGNESSAFEILETLLLKEKSLSASAEQLDIHDNKNLSAILCMTRLDLAKFYHAQKRH